MLDGMRDKQPGFAAPETLSSAVVGYIRDAILRGTYPPGSPLPEIPLSKQVDPADSLVTLLTELVPEETTSVAS